MFISQDAHANKALHSAVPWIVDGWVTVVTGSNHAACKSRLATLKELELWLTTSLRKPLGLFLCVYARNENSRYAASCCIWVPLNILLVCAALVPLGQSDFWLLLQYMIAGSVAQL